MGLAASRERDAKEEEREKCVWAAAREVIEAGEMDGRDAAEAERERVGAEAAGIRIVDEALDREAWEEWRRDEVDWVRVRVETGATTVLAAFAGAKEPVRADERETARRMLAKIAPIPRLGRDQGGEIEALERRSDDGWTWRLTLLLARWWERSAKDSLSALNQGPCQAAESWRNSSRKVAWEQDELANRKLSTTWFAAFVSAMRSAGVGGGSAVELCAKSSRVARRNWAAKLRVAQICWHGTGDEIRMDPIGGIAFPTGWKSGGGISRRMSFEADTAAKNAAKTARACWRVMMDAGSVRRSGVVAAPSTVLLLLDQER